MGVRGSRVNGATINWLVNVSISRRWSKTSDSFVIGFASNLPNVQLIASPKSRIPWTWWSTRKTSLIAIGRDGQNVRLASELTAATSSTSAR